MPEGSLIVIVLLVLLIVLVLVGFFLLQKKMRLESNSSSETTDGVNESAEVLQERLCSRQKEIDRLHSQLEQLQQELSQEREQNIQSRENISRQAAQQKEERKQQQEKVVLLENAREKMSLEFKNLANEILEKQGAAFSSSNEKNIQGILKPLNEKILNFEKKVEDVYDKESKERFSLQNEIKGLQELNLRMSSDAVNLTNALKGESKTQGVWGEVILERVLEKSGLTKGREYEVQVSLKTEEGRLRQPDVVVHLPENKDIIIDAKVSLSAYERYSSREEGESGKEFLKEHIQAIRTHIKTLSAKDYHNLKAVQSLDFVMMFLPVEPAFSLAVQHDNSLFTEAFDKNIILVGPSTLLATLRTIQNIWRYEQQNKNAQEIAKRAGALYDKFVSFSEDLGDVGKRLGQTQDSYDQAFKKLISGRGNLLTNVEKLKGLGARASKKMPDALLARAELEGEALDSIDSIDAVELIETDAVASKTEQEEKSIETLKDD